MPYSAPRKCAVHGCANASLPRTSRCADHPYKSWDHKGKSRHERGYGSDWDKQRARVLARDKYTCQQCLRANALRMAKEVDHIIEKADGGTDDDTNLQSLCTRCHKEKTQRSRINRRSRKQPLRNKK